MPGQFGEPLGRPAGGRGEHHLGLLGARQFDHRADGEGLAAARPAGEHRHLLRQRQPHRRLLLRSQLGAGALREPGQRPVPGDVLERGHPVLVGAQQPQQPAGQGDLGAVEGHEVDGGERRAALPAGHLLADHALGVGGQFAQAVDDQAGVDLEQLHGVGDELFLGEEAMSLVGRLGQGVLEARLDAVGAVVRDADGLGDAVGGQEADAPDVRGQAVGPVADDGDGGVAVLLVDAHREGGRDADALEKDHHLLDGFLLLPGRADHLGALGAETRHLDQPCGLLLDDVEGVRAEVLHDAVGDPRADALDEAGSQIAADALDGGGQHGGVVLDGELLAVLRVGAPAALHAERFAGLRAEECPDDGEEVAGAAAGVDPGDGVAALLVGVGDPLQDPFHHRCVDHVPTVPPGSDSVSRVRRPACVSPPSSRGPSDGRAPRFPLRVSPRIPPDPSPSRDRRQL